MSRRLVSSWILLALVCACADDRVRVHLCGDGIVDPGSVCLSGELREVAPTLTPHALRTGDYDGDGRDDLLILGLREGFAAELWRGKPEDAGPMLDGPVDPGLYGCSAHPAQGFLDRDAVADLLVGTCDSGLLQFLGASAGGFTAAGELSLPGIPRTTAIAALDGDEFVDVLVLVTVDGGLGLAHLHGRDGGFSAPILTALPPGPDFTSLAVGDLDGDGIGDAALVETDRAGGLEIAYGRGDGTYEAPAPLTDKLRPHGLAAGDLDDDGVAELVVGDADGGLVFALGATPTRAARLLGVAPLPLYTPHTLALVDVSGDELLDLAVTGLDDPRVLISEGDGDGGFRLPHVVEFDAPVDQLGVADLNGDGAPDLVAGTFSEQRVTVRLADP